MGVVSGELRVASRATALLSDTRRRYLVSASTGFPSEARLLESGTWNLESGILIPDLEMSQDSAGARGLLDSALPRRFSPHASGRAVNTVINPTDSVSGDVERPDQRDQDHGGEPHEQVERHADADEVGE